MFITSIKICYNDYFFLTAEEEGRPGSAWGRGEQGREGGEGVGEEGEWAEANGGEAEGGGRGEGFGLFFLLGDVLV